MTNLTSVSVRLAIGMACSLAGVLGTTADAAAIDRRVRIVNESSTDIVEFFGSNIGTKSWDENILGDNVIAIGESVVINFDDGTGYCIYDFKAVFADGDEVVRDRVNVCMVGSFRYTD